MLKFEKPEYKVKEYSTSPGGIISLPSVVKLYKLYFA